MAVVCMLGHPAAGHVNPTLPVVRELVSRGERVAYFATEPFRARIEAAGAAFRSYGEQALFERNLAAGGLLGGMAGLMRTTDEILVSVLAGVRAEAPDYLLVEAHAVWGNLAAQHLGLPTAALCSMFAINRALLGPSDLIEHLYGRAPRELAFEGLVGLTRYFDIARRLDRRFGTVSPDVIEYLGNPQALNIVLTSRQFQIGGEVFDDSYQFVGPAVAPSPAGDTPAIADQFDFVLDGRPVVFVSMGTMYNDEAALYAACFEAFGGRDWQVVMAVGHRIDRSRLPNAPANVVVREYVPQVALLARTTLFITHGGINSAHEAMLHGVPMIVLPRTADHHVVARRVAETGAGIVLERAEATAERLLDLAAAIVEEPAFRDRSTAIGDTLRAAGGPSRAADEIMSLTRGTRS